MKIYIYISPYLYSIYLYISIYLSTVSIIFIFFILSAETGLIIVMGLEIMSCGMMSFGWGMKTFILCSLEVRLTLH